MSKIIGSTTRRHTAWICCFENRTEGSNGEPDGEGYELCEDGSLNLSYSTGYKTWCIYKTESEAYEQAAFQMMVRIRENKTSYVEPLHVTVDVYPITFSVLADVRDIEDNGTSIFGYTIEKQPEYERLRLPSVPIERLLLANLSKFGYYLDHNPDNLDYPNEDIPF